MTITEALPEPDTHCHDYDTGLDVWSYSKELMLDYAARVSVAKDATISALKEVHELHEAEIAAQDAEIAVLRVQLRKFYGHAPGWYMNTCHRCNASMELVDKRCHVCAECADKNIDAALKESK